MVKQRLRLRFEKRGELRLISHLDLMRLIERAIRRAGLPIAMSEGFNPRPRLSFPLALGVDIEGLREIFEMDLSDWVRPAEVQARLNSQLPEGLRITDCRPISPHHSAQVTSVVYEIELTAPLPQDVSPQILLQTKELPVLRTHNDEQKIVDIRPYILDVRCVGQTLIAHLKVTPSGSARPEEIVSALARLTNSDIACAKITRTQVNIAADAESLRRLHR